MPTLEPNMGLSLPIIGTDSGLTWEQSTNANMTTIGAHTHAAGNGIPIQPNGLNINTALPFQGNQATGLGAAVFQNQTSLSTLNALYVVAGELWFNDPTNPIKITTAGGVNAGNGSISGLVSPASAAFSSGTFIWQSASNVAANMDFQSAIFRNGTSGSFGLTVQAPTLTANSAITLPLPAVSTTLPVMIDSSGNMSAQTIVAAQMGTGSVTSPSIASGAVTQGSLAARTIDNATAGGAGDVVYSSSSGGWSTANTTATQVTPLNTTLTSSASGRPIMLLLTSDGSYGSFTVGFGSGIYDQISLQIKANGLVIYGTSIRYVGTAGGGLNVPASCVQYLMPSSPSTSYAFTVFVSSQAGQAIYVSNVKLVAYEI